MAQEAKQYAQRNREGSNWFSHDGDAAKPASPPASEPAAATSEAPATAGEDSVDKSTTAEAAAAAAAPPARAQMIRPKCDSNEWLVLSYFCHCLNNSHLLSYCCTYFRCLWGVLDQCMA